MAQYADTMKRSSRKQLASSAKRLLPWLGTGLLLGYLAWTTDLDTIANSLAEVSLPAILALGFFGTLVTFVTDTWCVQLVLNHFVCKVTYRETLPVKATSYFLNILNYNVALVGMAFYLNRSKGAPFWKTLGSMFFLNVMDILALCVLLGIGLIVNFDTDVLDIATTSVAWVIVGGGLIGFVAFMALFRLQLPIPLVSRVYGWQILAPFREVTPSIVVRFALLRVLFLAQYLVTHVLFMWLFSVDVPLVGVLVYLPIFTFIQIVPISISGLGTTQLVMRHFYAPYVVGAAATAAAVVDAASTTAIFGFLIFRVIVAYLFLGDLSREVIQRAGNLKQASEQEEPTEAA